MRYLLIVIYLQFIVTINYTEAQTITELTTDPITKLVSITGIVDNLNLNKEAICKKITDWYFERFKYNVEQKVQDNKVNLETLTITAICDQIDSFTKKSILKVSINNVKGRSYLNFKKWKDGLDFFTINIWFKDNKFKYELIDFTHNLFDGYRKSGNFPFEAKSVNFASDNNWNEYKLKILNQSLQLIEEIKLYVINTSKKDKENTNF